VLECRFFVPLRLFSTLVCTSGVRGRPDETKRFPNRRECSKRASGSIIHIAMALFRFGERTLCGWYQNLGIGRHFDPGCSIWLTGRYESSKSR
jgi:hypothetical protein